MPLPRPPLLRRPWPWAVLSLVLLGLLGAQAYLSYKFPIKQDPFGHPFREHVGNRLVAYGKLLGSGHKLVPVGLEEIERIVDEAAAAEGADVSLVRAIAVYESYYLPNAISTTGAMGLMALMPETARLLGVRDPFDPRENVAGGARLLRQLSDEFEGDLARVAAAYNAGVGAVRRYGGVPPYAETKAYVRNVLALRDFFEEERQRAAGPGGAAH